MASIRRTMALLTLPAAALGALAGLVLPSSEREPPAGPDPAVRPPEPPPPQESPRDRRRRARAERAGEPGDGQPAPVRRSRRVVGHQDQGAALDPSFAARLSDSDADARHRAAHELLAMLRDGTTQTAAVDALQPTTAEGRRLRDAIVNAQTILDQIESGQDYERLDEEGREQVRLEYWLRVVPESELRAERRRCWELRVAGDAVREKRGVLAPGEAAWHALELARVRLELGEIGADEWARVRDASLGAFRAWVEERASARDAEPARVGELRKALERIEAAGGTK